MDWPQDREGTTTEQMNASVLSLHDLSSGCNNVLAHCGLRNAQVPAQCWYLYFKAMQACCWGSAQWGLRNAPEKVLRTSTAAQLGVRNGKFSH